ncbi:Hypothetical protein A7982_08213 [Minicystis rosea]|nr:Hypothetical protein A7982_08213 [Minicystis rosea]
MFGLTALAVVGCSSDPSTGGPSVDAGSDAHSDPEDAGLGDGGVTDSGPSDSGPTDSGPTDSGPSDSGPVDSGPKDGGPTDAGATSSGGSGGLTCVSTGQVVAGRSYCQVHIGSVDVRFIEPNGGTGPLNLALYIHGDGAGAYNSGSVFKSLIQWADDHHALVAAVLAPNGCAWWQPPAHDCNSSTQERDLQHQNAVALDAAIKGLRAAYDISNSPVFYYGSSGGSIFLTASFLPRYGAQYPGAFAINCGGEKPWDGQLSWDPSQTGGTQLFFTYGDADYLAQDSHDTFLYYQSLGFPVYETVLTPNIQHCAFDGHGRAAEVWNQYLDEGI